MARIVDPRPDPRHPNDGRAARSTLNARVEGGDSAASAR
ncbi:hypothetical protein SCE1572_28960 [Sorangium cellulosum So0157-2]|uniref:Uncharacterized protein n=1 Tax=Sorangium cellulosum So0157-2 TaxID=1254432 RepID=S4Y1U5_SORCE|nr:hypothetical protein SCE1572_28960 [Sorangium cellulosum So0157-2]